MPKVTQRSFDPRSHGRSDLDLRPYFFRRNVVDVFEEALDTFVQQHLAVGMRAEDPATFEQEVLREQRRTLFEHDAGMRTLFEEDFEAFCAALDDPTLLNDRLQRRWGKRTGAQSEEERRAAWDDHQSPARTWEDAHEHHHSHGHRHRPTLDDDPVYDAAFQWACRVERWSRRLYVTPVGKDRDVFRILANATLVPAKVAFGFSGTMDDDVVGFEVAVIGYRQAGIFLRRVLDSLANCYGKRIGRPQTVHGLVDAGRELLADIEGKVAELESEIRYRRGGG